MMKNKLISIVQVESKEIVIQQEQEQHREQQVEVLEQQ